MTSPKFHRLNNSFHLSYLFPLFFSTLFSITDKILKYVSGQYFCYKNTTKILFFFLLTTFVGDYDNDINV